MPGECPEHDEDFCMAGVGIEYSFCDKAVETMWVDLDQETPLELVMICIECGRNASVIWYKCCPEHVTEYGVDVICQSCVEKFHPNDPEFERP